MDGLRRHYVKRNKSDRKDKDCILSFKNKKYFLKSPHRNKIVAAGSWEEEEIKRYKSKGTNFQ